MTQQTLDRYEVFQYPNPRLAPRQRHGPIFQDDPVVFTYSMHQGELYPVKEESDFDIHLEKGVSDHWCLGLMHAHIPRLWTNFDRS